MYTNLLYTLTKSHSITVSVCPVLVTIYSLFTGPQAYVYLYYDEYGHLLGSE
jgi:hypothetical protein